MSAESSADEPGRPQPPKDVRTVALDDIDRRILTALHADARMSNSALADLVGIAASTCHGRHPPPPISSGPGTTRPGEPKPASSVDYCWWEQ